MAQKSSKALQNPFARLSQAEIWAEKTERALQRYPFMDISEDLVLKINPRAKRMALRVDAKKRKVNLVLPKRASMREAYKFALDNKYWIRQKIDELPETVHFEDGAVIPIFGQPRTINVTYNPASKITDIKLTDDELIVTTNKKDPSQRIRRFIVNFAKDEITKLSHEKAAVADKKIESISVKDTSSRWGSCSEDGYLSFSWRIIFAPWYAFDYVVAHEVAHLTHMDHSPAFWNHCADLSEDYSHGKTWMKRHSGELIRYN